MIRLLVVEGIVVVLAAVVIPQVARFSDRGDQGAIETLMSGQAMTKVTAGVDAPLITDNLDFAPGARVRILAN